MPDLRDWLLRCKKDLAQGDIESLLKDFREFQNIPIERLSREEAEEFLYLLEELLREAEILKIDYQKGLEGLAEIRHRLGTFFQQLRYLLLELT